MRTNLYYLTYTYLMDSGDHECETHELESVDNWTETVFDRCLPMVREQANNSTVIAASVCCFGGEISNSAHPTKRILFSKTFQPHEWL